MEKYASVLKPVTLKPARSSWTLPFSSKKAIEANEDSSLVFGYSSNALNTYKYDNATDIDDASMTFETAKNKLYEACEYLYKTIKKNIFKMQFSSRVTISLTLIFRVVCSMEKLQLYALFLARVSVRARPSGTHRLDVS